MTSTAVKETGSVLMNLAVAQAGRNTANTGGFQKVWDSQMNRENAGAADRDNETAVSGRQQLQRGSSLRASRPVEEEEAAAVEELSPEKQEQAMEVLNAAALEMMREIGAGKRSAGCQGTEIALLWCLFFVAGGQLVFYVRQWSKKRR